MLRRHGPMVWAVCRQLLSGTADAEDAFLAAFLALVRSARSIRDTAAVGGWLHGVAVRVAKQLTRTAARRRRREQKTARGEPDRPVPDAAWEALLAAVHDEISRLPAPLRTAFVLCDLQGVRQPDAAGRLGWKPGTLTGRLTRARQLLLERLAGRGLAP
ncbi:MAG: sigma-70 family RNA polymerase sigma factor, partial [Gemmataceae bacterium]|nr:sigma-70 family RNA polymerase sigma factor [Gemmataceae bacterium]